MKKHCLNLLLISILSFVEMDCRSDGYADGPVENCIVERPHSRSECIHGLFSIDGPLITSERRVITDRMIINDPRNKELFCEELFMNTEQNNTTSMLIAIASVNEIYCFCDYLNLMKSLHGKVYDDMLEQSCN